MKTSIVLFCAAVGVISISAPLLGYAADDKPATVNADASKADADKISRHQKKAECYKQANSQNLHGKARKAFVHDCMKK